MGDSIKHEYKMFCQIGIWQGGCDPAKRIANIIRAWWVVAGGAAIKNLIWEVKLGRSFNIDLSEFQSFALKINLHIASRLFALFYFDAFNC